MPTVVVLLGVFVLHAALLADTGPVYSADSVVNAADNQPGSLAPNTIATIYGTGLAYTTRALSADDIRGGMLPTVLPGTGVRVLVGSLPANIYYVSPNQINLLVPASLLPGASVVQVVLDGHAGPQVPIQLAAAAPALFQLDQQNVVALNADGSVITPTAPAKPGDPVVLYATGLGETVPRVVYGMLPTEAAPLKQFADFKVTLDGVAADASAVTYAGIAPGFAGLYQINLKLPASTGLNPEIRIGLGDQLSKPGVHVPVAPDPVASTAGRRLVPRW